MATCGDGDRQHRGDGEATARLRAEVERAAVHVGPLSHAGVSVAVRFRRIGPVAVVDDLQPHRGVVHLDQAVQPAGRGVPQHVGHRLLHDPVGGQVETRRQPSEVTDHPQGGLHTGQPDRLEQLAEPGEPGRRFGLQGVDRRTEHPEQPVHLGQRLPSGAFDRLQCGTLLNLVWPQQPPHPAGVQRHHADAVRGQVVQLAGDPQPLVGDRRGGTPVRLLFDAPCVFVRQPCSEGAGGDGPPGQPGTTDDQPGVGDVGDDGTLLDHDAQRHQHQGDRQGEERAAAVIAGRDEDGEQRHQPAEGCRRIHAERSGYDSHHRHADGDGGQRRDPMPCRRDRPDAVRDREHGTRGTRVGAQPELQLRGQGQDHGRDQVHRARRPSRHAVSLGLHTGRRLTRASDKDPPPRHPCDGHTTARAADAHTHTKPRRWLKARHGADPPTHRRMT